MSVVGFLLFFLALVFYLLPSVIAGQRKTQHGGAIFFINLIFGWTVLGWIAALIWACVEKPQEVKRIASPLSEPFYK